MADFPIPENPDFNTVLRMLEPSDPAHANLFNEVIRRLLINDAYLKEYAEQSYENGTGYTDDKIAQLIGGAPSTLDTLKELADAISENHSLADALEAAIGTKAAQAELDTHTGNSVIHVTQGNKSAWDNKAEKTPASVSTDGLMSKADKSKLDGVAANANNYTHPTTSGNKHVPAGGKTGQILKNTADGIAAWADSSGGFAASATAPENKELLWIDTGIGVLKYYNGTAWVATKAVFS